MLYYGIKILTIISNLAFLVPATVASRLGFTLVMLSMTAVVFISSLYHSCQLFPLTCVATMHLLQVLDFTFAQLGSTLMSMASIPTTRPMWRRWRLIIFFVMAIASAIIASGQTNFTLFWGYVFMVVLSFVLTGLASLRIYLWTGGREYVRFRIFPHFVIYVIFVGLGLLFFFIQETPAYSPYYDTIHAMWHICGAIGVTANTVSVINTGTPPAPAPLPSSVLPLIYSRTHPRQQHSARRRLLKAGYFAQIGVHRNSEILCWARTRL